MPSTFRYSYLLQNLAGSTKTPAETIVVFLLQHGSKVIAVALILLDGGALILDRVGWLIVFRLDQPVNSRSGETTRLEHIGNMDPAHPIQPFAPNRSLNRYRHTVNDHAVESHFKKRATNVGVDCDNLIKEIVSVSEQGLEILGLSYQKTREWLGSLAP
jgi:hypothetical protein